MLQQIQIKNFAIIDNLDLLFSAGMTTITGETGAGKSIVIDALDIALGDRADPKLIRANAKRSEIDLCFTVKHIANAKLWLIKHELDNEDDCIIRRIIFPEGRSRNFINGHPITLQQLRELGDMLVHVHGQHQHHALLKRDEQRHVLDRFAKHQSLQQAVITANQQWLEVRQAIYELEQNSHNTVSDLLHYQLGELNELALEVDEWPQLQEKHRELANKEQLLTTCHLVLTLLTESSETPALALLNRASQTLLQNQLLTIPLKNVSEMLNHAIIQVKEACDEISHYIERIDADGSELQKIEQRLSQIYELARKHRIAPEQLTQHHQQLKNQLTAIASNQSKLAALQQAEAETLKNYQKAAEILHRSRAKAATKLAALITENMQLLGMSGGCFAINCQLQSLKEPRPEGLDNIEFVVCTNPGHPGYPLAKVASGGELARLSLAIQVITAKRDATPTLVFDEVDVGIGGSTADIVGQLLRRLGNNAQVLCVTHLPQVAARGHHHLKIDKQTVAGNTTSHVQFLTRKQRIQEIARMVGGSKITEQTLAHAAEMLGFAEEQS